MRRLALVVATLALLVGGIGLYASMGDDAEAPRAPVTTQSATPSPADLPGAETSGSAAADLQRPEANASTSSPVGSGSTTAGSASSEASRDERASNETGERTGERAIRPRPELVVPSTEGDAGAAHAKRLRRNLEVAACHAPDLEARYKQMPAADANVLRARCAKHGVTLPKP